LADDDLDDSKMPLFDHLVELRRRLLYSVLTIVILFVICYYFSEHIYAFLVKPLADITAEMGGERRMIYTALQEAFFTYVKVAFFAAAFLGFPVVAIQIWLFVAPGLYKSEKKAFLPFLVATPVLFFLGGAFVYYFVFPVAWKFFLSFEASGGGASPLPIQLEAKVGEYLGLVMQLIFAFGLCFQIPVACTLLGRAGIISSDGMKSKRRYAIVVAFIAAAILTPPDVISQIGLAVPTIILYELSILAVRMIERSREREETVRAV
jgi:sec-independent protein translocase protein TatC